MSCFAAPNNNSFKNWHLFTVFVEAECFSIIRFITNDFRSTDRSAGLSESVSIIAVSLSVHVSNQPHIHGVQVCDLPKYLLEGATEGNTR